MKVLDSKLLGHFLILADNTCQPLWVAVKNFPNSLTSFMNASLPVLSVPDLVVFQLPQQPRPKLPLSPFQPDVQPHELPELLGPVAQP
jgi:hypothetical protein